MFESCHPDLLNSLFPRKFSVSEINMFGRFSNITQTFFYSSSQAIRRGTVLAKALDKSPQKNCPMVSPKSGLTESLKKKYPKEVDREAIANALDEAAANRRFSIY
jgi:hypothetical protein